MGPHIYSRKVKNTEGYWQNQDKALTQDAYANIA